MFVGNEENNGFKLQISYSSLLPTPTSPTHTPPPPIKKMQFLSFFKDYYMYNVDIQRAHKNIAYYLKHNVE